MIRALVRVLGSHTKPILGGIISALLLPRHAYLWSLVAGILYPFGFAPYNLWPLTCLSISCLYALLKHVPNKRSYPLTIGFLYGLGLFGTGIYWIHTSIHVYGHTPLFASIPMTLAFICFLSFQFSGFAWVFSQVRHLSIPAISFAILWIGFEFIRSTLLTGFPWLLAGYSLTETILVHYAPVIGIFGLSLITALAAATLHYIVVLRTPTRKRFALMALALLTCTLGFILEPIQWTQPNPEHNLNVALIQGNIAQHNKWDDAFYLSTLALYEDLSLTALKAPEHPSVDLLIWPEAAIPSFYHDAWQFIEKIDQITTHHQTAWLTGIPKVELRDNQNVQYFNTIISGGLATGEYKKQKLVPFGEYIPFSQWIRTFGPFFNLPMSDFSPGQHKQNPLYAQGIWIAPYICYEIVYPKLVREAAKNAQLLLTISNDAWFGDSIAPHQHFQIAKMRALETGKMLIRATNTGITGIVSEKGKTLSTAPLFTEAILHGIVTPFTGENALLTFRRNATDHNRNTVVASYHIAPNQAHTDKKPLNTNNLFNNTHKK